jgi:hypothetical protein
MTETANDSVGSEGKDSGGIDRRTVLKVGALSGAAGVLSVVGMRPQLAGAVTSNTTTVTAQTENFDDFIGALVQQGVIKPFNGFDFFYVPSNSSLTINQNVPAGQVSLITETRITVGQDHALQLAASVDDKRILFDPDMVQARYASPLRLLQATSFHPVTQTFKMELKNRTYKSQYFASMQSGANLAVGDWERTVVPFLSRISGVVG